MDKSALLVINPNASKGKGKAKAKMISRYFREKGWKCSVAFTRSKGHAETLACEGAQKGYEIIIAAGGDGTVNEVVNGIMKSGKNDRVKMGIIPVGRGNDFAWIAGVPTDWKKASDLILSGRIKETDVGHAVGVGQDKYFLNGMGFGFEPIVNFTAQSYKHINGMLSYIVAFLKVLFHPPVGHDVTINLDGNKRSFKTQQISLNNGRRMGSAFLMTPRAEIDDGLFDFMCTNKVFNQWGILKMVLKFLRGAMLKDKENFSYTNVKKAVIDVDGKGIEAHVDGEVFCYEGNHFEVEIMPSAISLFR